MKSLWFKAVFVDDILARKKQDTIRKKSSRLPAVGELVDFSVGPRTPFARARVIAIEDVEPEKLSAERKNQVASCIDADGELVRLVFDLL